MIPGAVAVLLVLFQGCSVNTVEITGPVVYGMEDTAVSVNDTVVLSAQVSGSGDGGLEVIWESVGKEDVKITSDKGAIKYCYDISEHLLDTITVYAVNRHSLKSVKDTIVIDVRTYKPELRAGMGDTSVFLSGSLSIPKNYYDTNENVERMTLIYSDSVYTLSPEEGNINIFNSLSDTGHHRIYYYYTDADSFRTPADTFSLYVDPCRPEVTPLDDTLINVDDTLNIELEVYDPNDTLHTVITESRVLKRDTSEGYGAEFYFSGKYEDTVVVEVTDRYNFSVSDTFVITYNDFPDTVFLSDIGDTLTVTGVLNDPVFRPDTGFKFMSEDNDLIEGDVKHILLKGGSMTELDTVYSGFGNGYSLTPGITGRVFWKFIAVDTLSDSCLSIIDSSFVIRRFEVCFAGHSIVVGLGCSRDRGGFRRMVIDSLKSVFDTAETDLRAVGPLTTEFYDDEVYDSVMGEIGNTSYETWRLMHDNPEYEPDLWIYMSGVNGNYYKEDEIRYTLLSMDRMFYNTPESPVVFINGFPVHDTVTNYYEKTQRLYTFNDTIERYAEERREKGYKISVVDGFSIMSEDSLFNKDLFHDQLHPNDQGYDSLGIQIIDKIRDFINNGEL